MGGPMNVYETDEFPYLIEEEKIIKTAIEKNYVVLGICLGAQMMAKALGAKVTKGKTKEIGWYDISLTEDGWRTMPLDLLERQSGSFSGMEIHLTYHQAL